MPPLVKMRRMKNLFHLGPRASTVRPSHTGSCHNCHAPVSETYCGQCGQKAHVHIASAHEFIHHFIGHYVAAEGKLWPTLKALLLRPGELTLEYIRGRRTRFIDPLRLLLTVSLLAFLAIKLIVLADPIAPAKGSTHPGKTQAEALAKMEPLQKLVIEAYRRDSPVFEENFAAFYRLSQEEQTQSFMQSWLTIGPTVALLMIPLMAFWLKLAQLGTGWRYGEHLVFSVHWLSAALLGLVFSTFGGNAWLAYVGVLAVYLLLSIRRVYGGSWILVLLRGAAVAGLSLASLKFCVWIILYGRMAMHHAAN